MNKKLHHIQQKINHVQLGLLRFHDKDEMLTTEVKTTANDDASLNCIITGDPSCYPVANKNVNLIQKNHDDYLYIVGRVGDTQQNGKVLSIHILKASWFVLKRKGSVSWLREKYVYETLKEEYA
ncbi:MAG TPA: hypothetical protein VK483_09365 [Chitinophagaceae bacterium]|nr:hypothetical protein [Chitinophagaceae bacterium]